jgi:hypothetical protein
LRKKKKTETETKGPLTLKTEGKGRNGSIPASGRDLKSGRVYFKTLNPKLNFVTIRFKS